MSIIQGQKTFTRSLRDSATEGALRTGWLKDGDASSSGNGSRVIARALVQNPRDVQNPDVIFEAVDLQPRPAGIMPWLLMVRIFSLTATFTPCLAVWLFLIQAHMPVHTLAAVSAILGVCFLQIAINIFNDVEDYRRLIDLPDTHGGSGIIQRGWWTPSALGRIAWIAFITGSIFGLWTIQEQPAVLAPIAIIAGLGVLGYSARNFGLKYLALGDVAVFIMCGPALTVGFSVAASGSYTPAVIWMGCFFGLLAMALLHVNNLQDLNLDRSRNVKTIATVIGFNRGQIFLVGIHIFASISVILAVGLHELPVLTTAAIAVQLALAIPWLKKIILASGPESALLVNTRVQAAQIHLASGAALCLSLALLSIL